MAFGKPTEPTIVDYGDISLELFAPGANNPEGEQAGRATVQYIWSDGQIRPHTYDLLLRLQDDGAGQAHLSALADLRDYIKSRIEAEVLP